MSILPAEQSLNNEAFTNSLTSATTSYKYYWLLALLDSVAERAGEQTDDLRIPMRRITDRMLALAAEAVGRGLDLGAEDKMRRHVNRVLEAGREGPDAKERAKREVFNELKKYVPQLWLRSFLPQELRQPLRGLDGPETSARLLRHAADLCTWELFPYRFVAREFGSDVVVFGKWRLYFVRNLKTIRNWALRRFAGYVRRRNPEFPELVDGMFESMGREILSGERQWWRLAIRGIGEVRCIYSGAQIHSDGDFALDHFVPHSLVGCSRPWNLVPAVREATREKRDSLPSERYISGLAELHRRALEACVKPGVRGTEGTGNWQEAYAGDLKLDVRSVPFPEPDAFRKAYEGIILPLLLQGESRGFGADWKWASAGGG